jgi:hypothetical protein
VVSATSMKKFMKERGFLGPLHVPNAKQSLCCEELKQAILAGINWDEIRCRATEVLFKRLKEEIIGCVPVTYSKNITVRKDANGKITETVEFEGITEPHSEGARIKSTAGDVPFQYLK